MAQVAAVPSARRLNLADRPALVDGFFTLALCSVSFVGFESTFQGNGYLLAGIGGAIFGTLLAALAHSLRQPLILLGVFTVAAFFLLGGATTAPANLSGFLPVGSTLRTLTDTLIHGWHQLATTLPPIDDGSLLALPYLMGLVAGAAGMALALRWRVALLPTVAPLALLAAVIFLGSESAPHLVAIGGTFGVLVLGWVVVRGRRLVKTAQLSGNSMRTRLMALGMCAVAAVGAVGLGPHLPGIGSRDVLRKQVTPPFDIGQYPSPLAAFRKYTKGFATMGIPGALVAKPLFNVSGLKPGQFIKLATLDTYDGLVWGASNTGGQGVANDTFQKVGNTITNPQSGTPETVTVKVMNDYAGNVWLPTAGAVTSIDFLGSMASQFKDLRYNLATGTAVLPDTTVGGESYSFTANVPDHVLDINNLPNYGPGGQVSSTTGGAAFATTAADWGGTGSSPLQRVAAIAQHMYQDGKYTDGANGYGNFLPGHSLRNLAQMVSPLGQLAGDDEQYAALLALMANQVGQPARVILGAQVQSGNDLVYGGDIHASVEVLLDDGSPTGQWYTIPWSEFVPKSSHVPQQLKQTPLAPTSVKAVPPPAPVRPPANLNDALADATGFHGNHGGWSLHIPGFVLGILKYVGMPIAVVAGIIWLILFAKAKRRQRRRSRGSTVHRISAAWRELLDYARDQGSRVSSGLTRREQAAALGLAGYADLARGADAHVFGAGEPTEDHVSAYWGEVDRMRESFKASLGRVARWRSALNLVSFLPLPNSGSAREN